MKFFRRGAEKPVAVAPAPAADEFVITEQDIARCATLLRAFDAAYSDDDAPDDRNIRAALRGIAEAGSGMPLSAWAPYTRGGNTCFRPGMEVARRVLPCRQRQWQHRPSEVRRGVRPCSEEHRPRPVRCGTGRRSRPPQSSTSGRR